MGIYFESMEMFQKDGGLKQTTITAKQLLPAMVTHMKRGDRQFSLYLQGRLPKSVPDLLQEAFSLLHLQEPFYTQHCARQESSFKYVSKNRIKMNFSMTYRMTREEQQWVIQEIQLILKDLITNTMSDVEKVIAVHDYIVRNHQYEMNTTGSPFTVYTFMHEKQGVCMAYALLFEKMMEELKIPCYYVIGQADGESDLGHAWNMVKLDDAWYHIDATWDDVGSKMKNHEIRYRYLLRSDAFMKKDHQWNEANYPQCLSERYQYFTNLYDVASHGKNIYYPKPKTASLMSFDIVSRTETLHLEERVQFCTFEQGRLYMSCVDRDWHLYAFEVDTKQLICVEERQVQSIHQTVHETIVHFHQGEPIYLKERATIEPKPIPEAHEVILTGYGNSWFGEYKGKAKPLRFISDEGLELLIADAYKQVTVDFLCHDSLQIQLTANQKPLKAEHPVIVTLPPDIAKRVGRKVLEIEEDFEMVL